MGVPEKFVGNYQAVQRFLSSLEALCRDRRAISALRDSDAYASFQGRWKLSVYYGLRFQVYFVIIYLLSLLGCRKL